jgi:hypothetical protein
VHVVDPHHTRAIGVDDLLVQDFLREDLLGVPPGRPAAVGRHREPKVSPSTSVNAGAGTAKVTGARRPGRR